MRNLREDKAELDPKLHSWVQRQRRAHGIRAAEGSCWVVEIEQSIDLDFDSRIEWLSRSPADCLHYATMYARARNAAKQNGHGSWTLEVAWGDGRNGPLTLRVRPVYDEEYYVAEEAAEAQQ